MKRFVVSGVMPIMRLAALCLLLARFASAQNSTATVPAGAFPYSVALNPVTNKVYVANQHGSSVTVIDGATNGTATVAVGAYPRAVAVNPVTNKIYVANTNDKTVTVIDGASNKTTTIAIGSSPVSVAVNPVTNKIYLTSESSNTFTVIDGATNYAADFATGTNPIAVAVNPVTNKIYVANQGSSNVTVIDGATNSTATVAAGASPTAIAVNPVTNKIYVANLFGSSVTVINGATNTPTTVAAGDHPISVAVNSATNKVYVANFDGSSVTAIDGVSNSTATVAAGASPIAIAANPVTNKIYVANFDGSSITMIDGASNTTATVAAGSGPAALAINPVTNKIYVPNENSSNVTVIDAATNSTASITVGKSPWSVAVNPVTNKIYVANYASNSVTVIDGATNSTASITAGGNPWSVAVNPVTNKIYVANLGSNNVTVIDGATNTTTTVAAGTSPYAVAVNPVTNKIYVCNFDSSDVTVIDGATNTSATIIVGTDSDPASPDTVAVNPVTNKIYVGNRSSGNVTVIDGATNTTTTVAAGTIPQDIAVNQVTNKIYVANEEQNTVTVIDGATNTTTTISVGSYPISVAVNPVTNKIYVANDGNHINGNVTVIDGATNTTATVSVGYDPLRVAVNPVSNKIYVAHYNDNTVWVIDGATNSTAAPLATGINPLSLAVNPVTNKVYVANESDNIVTIITEAQTQAIPLTTAITPLTGNQTSTAIPPFTFTATSTTVTQPDALYYQFDTWQSPWTAASGSNPTFASSAATLQPGFHILYAYATDGQDAGSTQLGSPLVGNIQAYAFLVSPPVVSQIKVGTNVPGTAFSIDGSLYTSTQTFAWTAGDTHTISTTSPQTGPPGTQYVFTQWSDGTTSPSETITVPNTATAYTANFTTQYLLTVNANPQGAGNVSAGGYFNANSVVPISAFPNGGIAFTGWTGGAFIASPASPNTTVTMTSPQSVVANFQTQLAAQTITFDQIPSQTIGTTFQLGAMASSGLPVSYSSSTPSICTVSGNSASLLSLGSCTITASQSGGEGYQAAASVSQTFQVNTATLTAILQSDPSTLNLGSAFACPSGQGPSPCSQSVTLTYNLTDDGFLETTNVLTDGAPNLDFTLTGNTCSGFVTGGTTCSVTVVFAPLFPGLRRGAVQLLDGGGNIVATTYIQGVGQAPQIAFGPGVQSKLGTGFSAPSGVAVDGAGNVFVADGGGLVYELPVGGGTPTVIGGGLKSPFGVAVDAAGNVFVTDNLGGSVVELSNNGSSQVTLTTAVSNPTGIAVDGHGNVYVADTGNNRILELPAGGGSPVVVPTTGLSQPFAVALDAAGSLYVADYGNGRVIMLAGGQQTTIASGIVPEGLAIDAAGDVYISDTTNHRVLRVPPGGAPTTVLSSSGGLTIQPQGLAMDASGNLLIADASNALVTELNRSQAPNLSFAATATGNSSSDSPQSVTVANIGNALLSFSGIAVPANFIQVPGSGTPADCTASSLVSPGAACNLSISFKPSGTGSLSGSLVLSDNALNAYPATQSIALVGHSLSAQTITFAAIASQTVGAKLTLKATASSSLTVSFSSSTLPVCTVSGNTATMLAPGACSITASQAGNAVFAPAATVTVTFTVLSNAPPTVVSLTPSSGTGKTQAFTAVYSDANGGAYLSAVYLLFNTSITSSNGCYVQYYPSSNLLYLKNDAGTALSTGVVPGSGTQVSNSQCTLSGTGSSYTVSGNTATLKAAVTFNATTPLNAYLDASDKSSNTSGWIQKGSWTPVPAMPSVVSLSPSAFSGKTQTFTAVFSDQAGGSYLNAAYVLFNGSVTSVNGCYVLYYPSSNLAYLKNDAGTANSIGITLGSAAQVSNSQCTLSGTGSSYTISGSTATLTLAIAFNGTATSNIYLYATDKGGNNTGFVQKGTWTPIVAVPSVVSVTPNSGTGLTQTFKGVYSDTAGASGLNAVYMLFNSTLSGVQGCYVSYNPISNLLFLKNAQGTANYPGIAPGTTVQLTNGYCTLSAAQSSYAVSGNTATLNLAITFSQSSAANIYMLSSEKNGSTSGWALKGTWTP